MSSSCFFPFMCPTDTGSVHSLLLPSPPTQASLHPLLLQPLGSLVSHLKNLDIHQDFHLPDDQFASLKLHKLRQVAEESGVEGFASPSYNTRSSNRHLLLTTCCSSISDPAAQLPLPLSLTPTISALHHCPDDKQAPTDSVDLQNLSIDSRLASQSSAEASSDHDTTGRPGRQQTEKLQANSHSSSTESVSTVNTHRSADHFTPQPHLDSVEKPADKVIDFVLGPLDETPIKQSAPEKQTGCVGVVDPVEDQRSKNPQTEHKTITKDFSSDCLLQKTPETVEACNGLVDPEDRSAETKHQTRCPLNHSVPSDLLLSPPLPSAPCPSALHFSPTLPSVGPTPLTSSLSAPSLTLPPPHSPSLQTLSPPALSPCPSLPSLPSSLPPVSPSSNNQVEHPPCQTASCKESGGVNPGEEEIPKEHILRRSHTLKVKGFSQTLTDSQTCVFVASNIFNSMFRPLQEVVWWTCAVCRENQVVCL